MLKLLLISFLFGLALAYPRISESRIVGGEDAEIEEAPWQAALLRFVASSYSFSCGGSIIRPTVILSAAKCLSGTTAAVWRANVGSANYTIEGQYVDIQELVLHESFGSDSNRFDFDVALLITADLININGLTIAIIALPAQNQTIEDGTVGLITGWGSIKETGSPVPILQKANMTVVSQELCTESYGDLINERMLCLGDYENGGIDACRGDAGGPFVVGEVLFGVTSWGTGCARPKLPGVWCRVPAYRDWIDSALESQNITDIVY